MYTIYNVKGNIVLFQICNHRGREREMPDCLKFSIDVFSQPEIINQQWLQITIIVTQFILS